MKRLSVLCGLIGLCLWVAGCSEDKPAPVNAPDPSKMAEQAGQKAKEVIDAGASAADKAAGAVKDAGDSAKEVIDDAADAVEDAADKAGDAVEDAADAAADALNDDDK